MGKKIDVFLNGHLRFDFRRFYKCDDGTAFRAFCPTGLYWDDERKFCTYKNEAKCGPLEPKKKEEEIDEALKVFPQRKDL